MKRTNLFAAVATVFVLILARDARADIIFGTGQGSLQPDEQKFRSRQATVAPRAEPSTRGARHWTGGRKQVRKYR